MYQFLPESKFKKGILAFAVAFTVWFLSGNWDDDEMELNEMEESDSSCPAGILNEGATCYVNSLLQSLFHIPAFRKQIYDIEDVGESEVIYQLQALFQGMQESDGDAVSASDLIESFGWNRQDMLVQNDVHELFTGLRNHLQKKLKGTAYEGCIQKFFRGIETTSLFLYSDPSRKVSTKDQEFYDLQLSIKGSRSIEESLKKYESKVFLGHDNKVNVEGLGKQSIYRQTKMTQYPCVLMIQLMRTAFEKTFSGYQEVKLDHAFHYGLELKVNQEVYLLYSVMVHEGMTSKSGHYYSYIKCGTQWFKFNDAKVTHADVSEVLQSDVGAYCLMYIKKTELKNMTQVNVEIPSHINDRSSSCSIM